MGWITDLFDHINLPLDLSTKLGEIESQFGNLEAEIVKLRIENQDLRDELAQLYKTKSLVHGDSLNDLQTEILITIAKFDRCEFLQIEGQLVVKLAAQGKPPLSRAAVKHHLEVLSGEKYITITRSGRAPDRFSLKRRGGQYLEDNNLWPVPGRL
jgi:hypothetical protein